MSTNWLLIAFTLWTLLVVFGWAFVHGADERTPAEKENPHLYERDPYESD